jgi:hypothetical protein
VTTSHVSDLATLESEAFSDLDQWDAKGAAEVPKYAAHEGVQACFVNRVLFRVLLLSAH